MPDPPKLPTEHRALVLTTTREPPAVTLIPVPQPTSGSVVVRILVANVLSYMRDVYNGARNHPFPTPLVTGTSAIGRVAAVGPDATALTPGQLVHIDVTVRGRDDPTATFLLGIHQGFSDGSAKLMTGEWRDATYAEYANLPLENCTPLNESRLTGAIADHGLGYSVDDLAYLSALLVPYGGLRDIDLRPGETIIVAPATGTFGGAAVMVALAMGATVIALGRNPRALERLAAVDERVHAVPITGDMRADVHALQRFGRIDAYFDISPPAAAGSSHLTSCMLALRNGGRISLMGGIRDDVPIPHAIVVHKNLLLKGKWMYDRDDIASLIRLVECGLLKIGESGGVTVAGRFALDDWNQAFTAAADNLGFGAQVLLAP